MNFQKYLFPLGAAALIYIAFQRYGWPGVALVTGALVMWLLLSFFKTLNVLDRAARQAMGSVGSAVMLNAKLKRGRSLVQVVAMTQSIGALQSPPEATPEVYRWTDGSDSYVDCTFQDGKLVQWTLERPPPEAG